ncbi:GTPase Era [bacterium]|nr:GTPase Era [bacterium]
MGSKRCGRVSIIGRGNVGKSTLFNSLLGEKFSIVTKWGGATRQPMTGILNIDWGEVVLVDTPTYIYPRNKLEKIMLSFIKKSLLSSHLALFVVDATFPPSPLELEICSLLRKSKIPSFLLINKMDMVKDFVLEQRMEEYINAFRKTFFYEVMPISAQLGDNLPLLLKRIKAYLPEKEPIFRNPPRPPEELLLKETIREEVTNYYHDKRPQSMEIIIKEFRRPEKKGKTYILAFLYIEDERLFPKIMGYKGKLLNEAKHLARLRCERFLKEPVYLDLILREKKRWRNDLEALKEFGYVKKGIV